MCKSQVQYYFMHRTIYYLKFNLNFWVFSVALGIYLLKNISQEKLDEKKKNYFNG